MVCGTHEQKLLGVIQALINPDRISPGHYIIQLPVNQQNTSSLAQGIQIYWRAQTEAVRENGSQLLEMLSIRMNSADVERSGPGHGSSYQFRVFVSGKK